MRLAKVIAAGLGANASLSEEVKAGSRAGTGSDQTTRRANRYLTGRGAA
jgi:hypothetical protein